MPGVPADPDLIPTPEFTHTFIKTYLEELAVLAGREKSSVTEDLIESYKTYTNKCTQVTTMTTTHMCLILVQPDRYHRCQSFFLQN